MTENAQEVSQEKFAIISILEIKTLKLIFS